MGLAPCDCGGKPGWLWLDDVSEAIGEVVRLARIPLEVATVQSEQVLVRSAFANGALVKHDDLIGVPDCRQAMGDDERGPPAAEKAERA